MKRPGKGLLGDATFQIPKLYAPSLFLFELVPPPPPPHRGEGSFDPGAAFDRLDKKNVGKGQNAGHQRFLLFPLCFQKPSYPGL